MSHIHRDEKEKPERGPSMTEDTTNLQLASALLQIRSGGGSPPTAAASSNKPTPPATRTKPLCLEPKRQQQLYPSSSAGSPPLSGNTHSSSSLMNQTFFASAQARFGTNPALARYVNEVALRNYLGAISYVPGNFDLGLAALQQHAVSSPLSPRQQASTRGNGSDAKRPSAVVSHPTTGAPAFPSSQALTTASQERRDSLIRKEQVEAALKSKPQRGRKREDLNELERMELTRTRNREHAKTTRIRKKARYQELLQEERKLQEYQEKEKLENARRATVVQFVKKRHEMILAVLPSLRAAPSGEEQQINDIPAPSVDEFVEDIDQFGFCENEDSVEGASASERMAFFDKSLALRVERCFGSGAMTLIQYGVRLEEQSVSLDCMTGGMAEIDISLSTNPPTPIQQGFLRVQFAGPESDKLSSVRWWPAQDFLERPLNAQVSHPSVVSLDPAVSAESVARANASDRGLEENNGGPGMNI